MDRGFLGIFTPSQTNTLTPVLNKDTGSSNFALELEIKLLLDHLIETGSTSVAAEKEPTVYTSRTQIRTPGTFAYSLSLSGTYAENQEGMSIVSVLLGPDALWTFLECRENSQDLSEFVTEWQQGQIPK